MKKLFIAIAALSAALSAAAAEFAAQHNWVIITGEKIRPGHVAIGIASNGLYTNGFSLARKILFDSGKYTAKTYLDELGEDLHNDLMYYYLNVFIFNSEKSQLIITSQETTLLSQDLINENRGVVWFVEKNKETASSEYARGDSFGLHKNLSLYNSYRIGRLGAKPELGSIFINLED